MSCRALLKMSFLFVVGAFVCGGRCIRLVMSILGDEITLGIGASDQPEGGLPLARSGRNDGVLSRQRRKARS